MRSRFLKNETKIYEPCEKVFDFFSKAENLNLITPPHLHFKILTPSPITMGKGTLIDYKLQLYKIPFYWKTEITTWEPPHRFVDTQVKGPYLKWVHQHEFIKKDGFTLMIDNLEYASPGWIAEPLIHHLFVKKNVENIFTYREKSLSKIFTSK